MKLFRIPLAGYLIHSFSAVHLVYKVYYIKSITVRNMPPKKIAYKFEFPEDSIIAKNMELAKQSHDWMCSLVSGGLVR